MENDFKFEVVDTIFDFSLEKLVLRTNNQRKVTPIYPRDGMGNINFSMSAPITCDESFNIIDGQSRYLGMMNSGVTTHPVTIMRKVAKSESSTTLSINYKFYFRDKHLDKLVEAAKTSGYSTEITGKAGNLELIRKMLRDKGLANAYRIINEEGN